VSRSTCRRRGTETLSLTRIPYFWKWLMEKVMRGKRELI
jgi:hypothetical protein